MKHLRYKCLLLLMAALYCGGVRGTTTKTVHLSTAGTLPQYISDSEKYEIEELTITGSINGTDVRLIRDMAGCDYQGKRTEGKLKVLDISGANIVEGGLNYLETTKVQTHNGSISWHNEVKYSTISNALNYYTFVACNLEEVRLSNTITTINGAFYDCIYLKSVNVPTSLTSLYSSAFWGCSLLESFNLPASLTYINGNPFAGCSSMTFTVDEGNPEYDSRDNCNAIIEKSSNKLISGNAKTIIPSSVKIIGQYAFYNSDDMTSITIPEGVTEIENYAFYSCDKLASIKLPMTLKTIGIRTITSNNALTSIVIPQQVSNIGSDNFSSCSNLNSVYLLSSSLSYVGNDVFYRIKSPNTLYIPDFLSDYCSKNIPWSNFTNIQKLRNVYSDELSYNMNVNSLTASAYSRDADLTTTSVPAYVADNSGKKVYTVTAIGEGAFTKSPNLSSLSLPATVTHIVLPFESDNHSFKGCPELRYITIDSHNPRYLSTGSAIIDRDTKVLLYGRGSYIPSDVTSIANGAFQDCKPLINIEIPGNVARIGNRAFKGCSNLETVIIDEGVKEIGDSAFAECSSLTSLSIPEGIESIGKAFLADCTSLKDVYCFATTVPNLQSESFTAYSATLHVPVSMVNAYKGAPGWNLFKNIVEIAEDLYTYSYSTFNGNHATITGVKDTEITIAEIPEVSFNINDLKEYTVTGIDKYAFEKCKNLKELYIPHTITSIYSAGFENLDKIVVDSDNPNYDSRNDCNAIIGLEKETVVLFYGSNNTIIPEGVQNISSYAFKNCRRLKSIHIPSSVSYLSNASFYGCTGLETITTDNDNAYYTSPEGSNTIIRSATKELVVACKSSVFPSDLLSIGNYAFSTGMPGVETLNIPEGVTNIGNYIVNGCEDLTTLILPSTVSDIQGYAFSGSNTLKSIYILANKVPTISKSNSLKMLNATIYVPASLFEAYQNDSYWSAAKLKVIGESDEDKLQIEYFINNDPGIGKAKSVYAIGNSIDFNLNMDELKPGINVIGFRPAYQNAEHETTFGTTHYQYIYRSAANGQRDIERIEYFWDEDPGKGNGTAIPFQAVNDSAVVNSIIDYRGLYGPHLLCIRAMSKGVWSNLYQQTVILPAGILSGDLTLDMNQSDNIEQGIFNTLASLFGALSTRGFDIGLNINVTDGTYSFQVSENSIAIVQLLYEYLISKNFYISMKAKNSATFNFVIPMDFIIAHASELPQIVAAVQALFSHIVTENISILINGQTYQYDGFQVEPNDLLSLKNLYNRLNGENWTQKKWSFLSNGRDKNELPGVEFDENGNVTSIDLYNNNLEGVLSKDWELGLPYLTYLQLSQNNIEGDLSPFLRYTPLLKSLYMSNNCLTEISDTLPSYLTTIDLKYQFKTGSSNSELKQSYLDRQQPHLFYISNKQKLSIPTLFTYNQKYMDHSLVPTVYLLDSTNYHNTFAYYTNQYGFAWKSNNEYRDQQDARYLVELSDGSGIANGSVIPMRVRYIEGDANMTGATDVLDVQHTLNRILGSVWNFNYSAANTYADATINVQDIVCTVNIILAQPMNTANARRAQASEHHEAWLYANNGQLLLATTKEVGALDIELTGVSTSQVSLLLNHSQYQMIGHNTERGSRYIIFSPTGQVIPAGEVTSILRISGNAEIVGAQAADATAEEVVMAIGQEPTGIAQLMDGTLNARFQDNQLVVKANRQTEGLKLRLTSTGGAIVYSTRLDHVTCGETRLSINLVPGVYLLELTTTDGARKIVKLMKR